MCLGYKAFIFAFYFICVSSLFDSSKADSPRVEYIGFPASSVYCPGFLAEAEAMFFYLLVLFWFDSWDFGPLPPRLPEILLSFRSCAHARPPCSAARVPPLPKGSHRHVICFPEQLSSRPSLVLSGLLSTLTLKIAWPGGIRRGHRGRAVGRRCPQAFQPWEHPAVDGTSQPRAAPMLISSRKRDLDITMGEGWKRAVACRVWPKPGTRAGKLGFRAGPGPFPPFPAPRVAQPGVTASSAVPSMVLGFHALSTAVCS